MKVVNMYRIGGDRRAEIIAGTVAESAPRTTTDKETGENRGVVSSPFGILVLPWSAGRTPCSRQSAYHQEDHAVSNPLSMPRWDDQSYGLICDGPQYCRGYPNCCWSRHQTVQQRARRVRSDVALSGIARQTNAGHLAWPIHCQCRVRLFRQVERFRRLPHESVCRVDICQTSVNLNIARTQFRMFPRLRHAA